MRDPRHLDTFRSSSRKERAARGSTRVAAAPPTWLGPSDGADGDAAQNLRARGPRTNCRVATVACRVSFS